MAANGTASIAYNAEFKLAQRRVLFILYCTYAGFYLSRKADSVVKAKLHEEEGFSMEDLAFLDTVYLAVYTVALAGSGVFGGYFSSNKLLSGALVLLALTSFLKARSTSVYMFACCQIIHAMCQSVGWPTCIKLIGTWVTENRGFVMGLWTTCQSMGGILGAVLGTFFSNASHMAMGIPLPHPNFTFFYRLWYSILLKRHQHNPGVTHIQMLTRKMI